MASLPPVLRLTLRSIHPVFALRWRCCAFGLWACASRVHVTRHLLPPLRTLPLHSYAYHLDARTLPPHLVDRRSAATPHTPTQNHFLTCLLYALVLYCPSCTSFVLTDNILHGLPLRLHFHHRDSLVGSYITNIHAPYTWLHSSRITPHVVGRVARISITFAFTPPWRLISITAIGQI